MSAPSATSMRAFVVEQAGSGAVRHVDRPQPGSGEAIVAIRQVGVCGTDTEFFRGTQHNLAKGTATSPLRLGHEWSGVVDRVGPGVDPTWIGARVTGDTMLGCGDCAICHTGRQHVCPDRFEIGVRGGWPGALADRRRPGTVSESPGTRRPPGPRRSLRGRVTVGEQRTRRQRHHRGRIAQWFKRLRRDDRRAPIG
jgi:Alcohol dehydrogenase GroES-like domain